MKSLFIKDNLLNFDTLIDCQDSQLIDLGVSSSLQLLQLKGNVIYDIINFVCNKIHKIVYLSFLFQICQVIYNEFWCLIYNT